MIIVRNTTLPAYLRLEALNRIDKLYRIAPEGEEKAYNNLPSDIQDYLERKWAWQNSQMQRKSNCRYEDTLCIPDADYKIPKQYYDNMRNLTMQQLMAEYGLRGIHYVDCQPDFSVCQYDSVDIESLSFNRYEADIQPEQKMDGEGSVHEGAIKAFAQKWGKTEQYVRDFLSNINEPDESRRKLYVLHECANLKTVMIVPREIHAFFKHSGGISLYKAVFL